MPRTREDEERIMTEYTDTHWSEITEEYKKHPESMEGRVHDEEIYEEVIWGMMRRDGVLKREGIE